MLPKNVTTRLQEQEIKLVRETGFAQSKDHSRIVQVRLVIPLTQIEAFGHYLTPILYSIAKVVELVNFARIFLHKNLDLNLDRSLQTQQARLINFDVHF